MFIFFELAELNTHILRTFYDVVFYKFTVLVVAAAAAVVVVVVVVVVSSDSRTLLLYPLLLGECIRSCYCEISYQCLVIWVPIPYQQAAYGVERF